MKNIMNPVMNVLVAFAAWLLLSLIVYGIVHYYGGRAAFVVVNLLCSMPVFCGLVFGISLLCYKKWVKRYKIVTVSVSFVLIMWLLLTLSFLLSLYR